MNASLIFMILFTVGSLIASFMAFVVGVMGIRGHRGSNDSMDGQDVAVFILMSMPLVWLVTMVGSWYRYFH